MSGEAPDIREAEDCPGSFACDGRCDQHESTGQVSGEARLSDEEVTRLFDVWRAAGPNEASPVLVLATVNKILADRARLAAVPVPSETCACGGFEGSSVYYADCSVHGHPVPSDTGLAAAVEALLPTECWVTRSEVRCTGFVGGIFGDKASTSASTFTEEMCCLPCRLRALLFERTATTGGGGS